MINVSLYIYILAGGGPGVAEAAVPLRQRGRRHAHALRRADNRGMARVRLSFTLHCGSISSIKDLKYLKM